MLSSITGTDGASPSYDLYIHIYLLSFHIYIYIYVCSRNSRGPRGYDQNSVWSNPNT